MAKLPPSPGAEALRAFAPELRILRAGTALARIYFTDGRGATRWNAFRRFGPLGSRFDHHVPDRTGAPCEQERAILYAAVHIDTRVAEVLQQTRRVDRTRGAPWLAVFAFARDLALLDLTGAFCTRIGACMAIASGSRKRARDWSQDLYEAYGTIDGLYYPSSMNGHAPALVTRGQPDAEVIRRHLQALEDALTHLRPHAGNTAMQLCTQNALDVATHIAAGSGVDAPEYATIIDRLAELRISRTGPSR